MEQIIFTFTSIVNFALAVLAWYQYNRRKKLQNRLDASEYDKATLICDKNRLMVINHKLTKEIESCKRVRDEKGRYIKK